MKASRTVILAASTLTLAGCVNLAPVYERGVPPIPAELPVEASASSSGAALHWEDVVVSAQLRDLIVQALAENRDLQVVAANVRVARAQLGTARSGFFPRLTADASAQEGGTFEDAASASQSFSDSASAGLGVTAWELDFFGRIASTRDAAREAYLASEEGQRAARIALVATICEAWLQLAADKELLALAEETVRSQSESFDLTRALLEAGAANELDVRRASASVQTARAQAAQFEALVRQDLNLLRFLVGADLPQGIAGSAVLTPEPLVTTIPVGASSEILLTRPDLIAAERQLRAANANIGAARAAYFPSISLTGSAGYVSADLSGLVGGDGTGGWRFGPGLSLPIFDGGARRSNLASTIAARDAALANYERAIQAAFRETADALAVAATIDTRLSALQQLAEDTDVTLSLSEERFKTGIDDYLAVLDAQREYYSGRQQLIAARLDRGRNSVALFRALGNWSETTETPRTP